MIKVYKAEGETGLFRALKVDPDSVPLSILDAAVDLSEMADHLRADYAAELGGEDNIPEAQLAMLAGIDLCASVLHEMSNLQ